MVVITELTKSLKMQNSYMQTMNSVEIYTQSSHMLLTDISVYIILYFITLQ